MVSTSKNSPEAGHQPDKPDGAPNEGDRTRGSRAEDPRADSAVPGREFGAGGQKEDGPDASAGAGSDMDAPGGRGSSPARH